MNKAQEGSRRLEVVQGGTDRLKEVSEAVTEPLMGIPTARIHSRLREDLPSLGQELIDFSNSIGQPLLPWQEWLALQAHRVKADGLTITVLR